MLEENGNLGGGYEEFRRTNLYGRKISLETVLLRSEGANGDYARARIKGNGRITAHGNDFLAFLNVVTDVQKRYAAVVRRVENTFRLRATEGDHGIGFEGQALSVGLRRAIEDPDLFFEGLCAGAGPFRLLGLSQRLTDQLLRGRVLDLHIFEPLTLEIAKDFIRVYLPERTCGNTVVRLISLLEHHYDPTAEPLNLAADAA